MNIIDDIKPISFLKQKTSEVVKRVKTTKQPTFITINGNVELVIQDAESYQKMVDSMYSLSENDILKINRSQTRQIDVHYTFYGDENIQDIAYEFRNKLFSYKAKEFLDKYDIKLILNVPEAILNYEQVRNQWWSRVDFVVSYYLESKLVEELEVFTSTNVSVVTEKESLNKSFSVMTDNN